MSGSFNIGGLPSRAAPGRLFKLATSGNAALATVADVPPYVDVAKMSATFPISTDSPDRIDDVVVPGGVILDNYRRNPVVGFEHFFDLTLPIGRSEDGDGRLALSVEKNRIMATCYFSQTLREAEQIYHLVCEKILRGASVQIGQPFNCRTEKRGGRTCQIIDSWPLIEWSIVALPMNAEAVAGVLSKGRLCGTAIAPAVYKSLSAAHKQSRDEVIAKIKRYVDGLQKRVDELAAEEEAKQAWEEKRELYRTIGEVNRLKITLAKMKRERGIA